MLNSKLLDVYTDYLITHVTHPTPAPPRKGRGDDPPLLRRGGKG